MDYSGESSERKEKSYTEASIISENTYIIMNKILVEMWTLRMLLVKSHLEIRNMLLEIEEDRQWLRIRLNCQKVEHVSYDIGYLAEKVSKQSVEGMDMFFWSKRWTEKELLSKKEWDIKDLENVQPILRKLRNICSGGNTKHTGPEDKALPPFSVWGYIFTELVRPPGHLKEPKG